MAAVSARSGRVGSGLFQCAPILAGVKGRRLDSGCGRRVISLPGAGSKFSTSRAGALAPESDAFAELSGIRANTGAAVAARLDIGGSSYVGTNLARGNVPIDGTFSFFVQHAEGDALSQAMSSANYTGQSGSLYVTQAPCGFCVSGISATARQMGLRKLIVVTPTGVFGTYTP